MKEELVLRLEQANCCRLFANISAKSGNRESDHEKMITSGSLADKEFDPERLKDAISISCLTWQKRGRNPVNQSIKNDNKRI